MSRPIRILLTTSNFHKAGSGKVIHDLVKGIDKNNFQISIACGNNLGEFFKEVEALGVPIYIYETKTQYRPYHNLYRRIWDISKFYREHQFDIIHSWQWSSDWTEALAAKLAGVKWIYTKKAMGFKSKHWKIKSYLADYIITINDEMRGYFPKKKQQSLIPLGIDTDYYNPSQFNNNQKLTDTKFKIITVANLVPVKGVEVLLTAIKKLNDKNLTLTIVGDYSNTYGEILIAKVQDLGMESYVDFLGIKIDVRPYIAQADLFVIPTLNMGRKEGMPMALVEAMSMGVPVLGSDISGINYVLKDFGDLLFPAGDVAVLSQKIKEIQTKNFNERKVIGFALRDYCISNFSSKSFINNHETLYRNLLK
ncbi:glycosyltransferase family 4 protein [Gelidibacter sp. F2691]|nr:glycosyltransferase family 4 protein [Gelidibacter sp. F2691]